MAILVIRLSDGFQLREAWPWDTAPRFLVRDRDGIYGPAFQRVAQAMGSTKC